MMRFMSYVLNGLINRKIASSDLGLHVCKSEIQLITNDTNIKQ